jgi:hypothetical protein
VKTLVDEQEIQSSPAIAREERSRQGAPNGIVSQIKVVPVTTSAPQSLTDCYESCLDLSALFIARG